MSGVQQMVATAGLLPATEKVAPGSCAATCEVTETTASGSTSEKDRSTQKFTPSQTSISLVLVMMPLVMPVGPRLSAGGSAQLITTKRKSRITVPMSWPSPL